MKKIKVVISVLIFWLIVSITSFQSLIESTAVKEERGLWVSVFEFYELGLGENKSKSDYTKKLNKLYKKAKYCGVNSIYFHVRAFDDAVWNSKTFKPSKYLVTGFKSSAKAVNVYKYDPLEIAINRAHTYGLKFHAWLNPYRVSHEYYYDPGKTATTKRILTAISELNEYKIDGIHMDDYFYTAKKGYRTVRSKKKYKVRSSAKTKREKCNIMIRAAYKETHKKEGRVFGISPAGNYENCMNMGADVKTWLSKNNYLDYIAPQIYWTDNWGSKGKTKMFTKRAKQFKALNKIKLPMYLGLALYRAGLKHSDDKGWGKRNTNIKTQIKKERALGLQGFILFSGNDLFDKNSAKERKHMRKIIKAKK